jgi:uncharacterized membrane protein
MIVRRTASIVVCWIAALGCSAATSSDPTPGASADAPATDSEKNVVRAAAPRSHGPSDEIEYRLVALPPLPGDVRGLAGGMNDEGVVVGASFSAGDAQNHAVMWRDGQARALGALPGDINSSAAAISNTGFVVGDSDDQVTFHSVSFEHDRVDLMQGPAGVILTEFRHVNDRGQAAGTAQFSDGFHAVRYQVGGPAIDYGIVPGFVEGFAAGIDENGRVGGWSTASDTTTQAFLSAGNALVPLQGLPGNSDTAVLDMNAWGLAAGYSGTRNETIQAVLFDRGSVRALGMLPGDTASDAFAVNVEGSAGGFSFNSTAGFRAALFADGAVVDVNTRLARPTSWRLWFVNAINARGQLLVSGSPGGAICNDLLAGCFNQGEQSALLTPVRRGRRGE